MRRTASYNPFNLAKKYLTKSHDGKINVCYKQNGSVGRFNACGSLSMQNLPREIRHTIADGYTDIDMENAHPVILHHLCAGRHIATPYLKRYIENRDKYLAQIHTERQIAKDTIISILNGGDAAYKKVKDKPSWLKKFKLEIEMIQDTFAKDTDFKKVKREYNPKGSYMNLKLCEFENKILMCMWNKMGNPNNCVLCFDGLMVRDEYNLPELEHAVFKELKSKYRWSSKE